MSDTLILALLGRVIGREFTRRGKSLERAQWLDRDLLRQRMEAGLLDLLVHASGHVPFYRDHLPPAKLAAGSDDPMAVLRSLPIVNKSTIRSQGLERFTAAGLPQSRRFISATSGSTEPPFHFYADREALPTIFASHLFYDSWFDLRLLDRYVRIVVPQATAPGEHPCFWHWARLRMRSVYERLTQRIIPVWDVGAGSGELLYQRLAQFRPSYIMGYTSTLAVLAAKLSKQQQLLPFPLKAVIVIAEPLTADRARSIGSYFQGPIVSRYGQREFGFWGAQSCPANLSILHINTELIVPEVLREDGSPANPGELGRLVMTDLVNRVMPLIRYDTGDIAAVAPSNCRCGRGFPILTRIEGRAAECFRTRSGEWRGPSSLAELLLQWCDRPDAIQLFQLVEESEGHFVLKIVPQRWREDLGRVVEKQLQDWLGGGRSVDVRLVEEIELEPSGKRPVMKLQTHPPFAACAR